MSHEVEKYALWLHYLNHHKTDIVKALAHSRFAHTFEDVVKRVMAGQAFIYADDDSFVIVEVLNFPRASYLNVWLAGGELDAVQRWEEALTRDALSIGCTHLSGSGRKGWERPMQKQGWEHLSTTLIKELPRVH